MPDLAVSQVLAPRSWSLPYIPPDVQRVTANGRTYERRGSDSWVTDLGTVLGLGTVLDMAGPNGITEVAQ